nr:DUF1289 domain-containing protein [uncultured Duganella sp.]
MSEPTNLTAPDGPAPAVPVPSPCVSLCKMDAERRYCVGCLRTIDEIVNWSQADDDYKRAVWVAIGEREQTVRFDDDFLA